MRILVVGAGAVGTFLGALLAGTGHDVTLVGLERRSEEHGRIRLRGPDGSVREAAVRRVPFVTDAPAPDLIVFGVKMFDLETAAASCSAWPETPALTIENGIGAEEIVAGVRPAAGLIAASLTAPIELVSPDEVNWLGQGGLGLAAFRGPVRPLVDRLAADFSSAGLRARRMEGAAAMKWSKLLANLIANATGAILDMDGPEIYRNPRLFAIERRQLLEAIAVMHALGLRPVRLPGAAVPWLARAFRLPDWLGRPILGRVVGGARGGKTPSLRLHVQRGGGPSEVAWLNGAVASHGARAGVPTPVNARLAELVEDVSADARRAEWLRRNPERFLGELESGRTGRIQRPILPGDADS